MNRVELVLLFIAIFLLAVGGFWFGWRNREKRQADLPPLAAVPVDLGNDTATDLAPPLAGLYVGTTIATEWQNRVVVHTLGLRAEATARLTSAGALIDRQGSPAVFIPAAALIDARLEPALAGKVVGRGGLLVLRWQHGDSLLDTGLLAEDKTRYPDWITAVTALVGGGPGTDGSGRAPSHARRSDSGDEAPIGEGMGSNGQGNVGDE